MKWLALRIGGRKWDVHIVSDRHKRLHPEGSASSGVTYHDEGKIYLAREQSETSLEDTLLHELLHAILQTSRGSQAIANAKLEETIVERITPFLHQLLKDLGFRFPKGTAA